MRGFQNWRGAMVLVGFVFGGTLGSGQSSRPVPTTDPSETSATAVRILTLEDLRPSADQLFNEGLTHQAEARPNDAINAFLDFLRYYASDSRADEAIFRVAECYRALGRFAEAEQSVGLLAETYPESLWNLSGRVLRAEMRAAEQRWKEVPGMLQSFPADAPLALRLRVAYLRVLALDHLNQLPDAQRDLAFLATEGTEETRRSYAALRLGWLEQQNNRPDAALKWFRQVLQETQSEVFRAEAAVRAGNLELAAGRHREAASLFEIVRQTPAPDVWKRLAHYGLVRTAFMMGDFAKVTTLYRELRPAFPEEARESLVFLVAESYRLQKQYPEALLHYDFLLKEFPQTAHVEAARWARLLIFSVTQDRRLIAATSEFIARHPKSPHLPMVKLMRAEAYFRAGDFKTSAPMFNELVKDPAVNNWPEENRQQLAYQRAFALHQTGNFAEAVPAFRETLAAFPRHPHRASLLWVLGRMELDLDQPQAALKSWTTLVQEFPDFADREIVLWKTALLAGQEKLPTLMRELLEKLLNEFPQTAYAAEANFRIAWCWDQEGRPARMAPHLRQARSLDPERFFVPATRRLIEMAVEDNNPAAAVQEVEAYDAWRLGLADPSSTPPIAADILEWLADQLIALHDTTRGATYLRRTLAQTTDPTQKRRAQLRLARLMSAEKNWGAAIREWEAFRTLSPEDRDRSAVLEPLALAYLGAGQYETARRLADQILMQNPEGPFNAKGRLILGEIAFAQTDYKEAARQFFAVTLLLNDPEITPVALSRAAEVYRILGDRERSAKLLATLREQFPDYQPSTGRAE